MSATPSRMSRSLGWALATIAIASSLCAMLYLAFTLWRKTKPNATWTEALIVDALLMGLFALQHSGMARPGLQRALLRKMPLHVERPLYAALSGLVFLALAWFWKRPPGMLWDLHGLPGGILRGLAAASVVLLVIALIETGALRLLGVKALREADIPPDEAPTTLVTDGLYAYVRHPLLVFTLFVFWIWAHMTAGHALFAAGFTIYVAWAVPREERSLRRVFGADYEAYAARVPRWIPRIPKRTTSSA